MAPPVPPVDAAADSAAVDPAAVDPAAADMSKLEYSVEHPIPQGASAGGSASVASSVAAVQNSAEEAEAAAEAVAAQEAEAPAAAGAAREAEAPARAADPKAEAPTDAAAPDLQGAGAGGGATGNASASGTSAGADGEEGVSKDASEACKIGDQIVDLLAKARDSGRPVKKEHFRALCDFVMQQKTSDPVEAATELMSQLCARKIGDQIMEVLATQARERGITLSQAEFRAIWENAEKFEGCDHKEAAELMKQIAREVSARERDE